MREIKFRAWDRAMERMLNNVGFHPYMCCKNDDYASDKDGAYTISPHFTNYYLMQYTGLKDKNGVEIYEGDVLRVPYNSIDNQSVIFLPSGTWSCSGLDLSRCRVIGNIHQNPELLK